MTDLLQRLSSFIGGKANRFMDELEDPREQLGLFVNDLNAQLRELRQAVAPALADEKRLRLEIRDHLSKASDWERRAVLALEDGDENLARQALLKKEDCDQSALALQADWEEHHETARKLKETLEATKRHVEETRRKYALAVARYESAQVQKRIAESMDAPEASPGELVERLNEKIRQLESETAVELELSDGSGTLEARFVELERRRKGDDALAALKASLGEPKSLPPESSSRIDALKAKLDES